MRSIILPAVFTLVVQVHAQFTNVACTNAQALLAMKGQHDPANYAASVVIDEHAEILCELRTRLVADSLKAHLQRIVSFGTRHTYSDTVSETTGIGAARRWAFEKFQAIGAANESRLIPAYLQFDYANETNGCGDGQGWRNVMAVLPGSSVNGHRVVIIEAHLDSRCEDNCDPACEANGAEDNGSGCALVIELARAMSKYSFDHTLVFMLTTGEEHGLLGARAMAQFCTAQGIAVKGVLNNDVIGGILCGHTASPPGCTVPNEVDSLQLRIFSHGNTRGLGRMLKLSYQEKLRSHVPVPMLIGIQEVEDRIGRGGDHIPFRQAGFQSIRFTAANEHGNGDPSVEGYEDRQHTSSDLLGVDTDGDLVVDSFFVNFNYLQRNAVINGMGATLLALGPETPTYSVLDEPAGLRVSFTGGGSYAAYRIGVRGLNAAQDFEALYRTDQTSFLVPGLEAAHVYYVSAAGVDADGITSPFGLESIRNNDANTPPATVDDLPYTIACMPIGLPETGVLGPAMELLPCQPNPFTDRTDIVVRMGAGAGIPAARIVVRDIHGRMLFQKNVVLQPGLNRIEYHARHGAGVYLCELWNDGHLRAVQRMLVLD